MKLPLSLVLFGVFAIIAGFTMIYVPLGLISAGIIAFAAGMLVDFEE